MRKVTIKRIKTIVACLMKVKFYVEDKDNGKFNINGFPCSFLGTLKNGEEKTFEISENTVKIFAVVSTDFFMYTFHTIFAGKDDIYLSGKNVYKPFSGNPFVFL